MQDTKEKLEPINPTKNSSFSKDIEDDPTTEKKQKKEPKNMVSKIDDSTDNKEVDSHSLDNVSNGLKANPEVDNVLKKLNPKDRKLVNTVIAERHSGPIPHPRILAGYEKILPGSADRIIKMAEEQSNHRMNMEKNMLASQISYKNKGLNLGFILGAILLLGGLGLLFVGRSATGLTVLAGAAVAIAVPLITGKSDKHQKSKENDKKADE